MSSENGHRALSSDQYFVNALCNFLLSGNHWENLNPILLTSLRVELQNNQLDFLALLLEATNLFVRATPHLEWLFQQLHIQFRTNWCSKHTLVFLGQFLSTNQRVTCFVESSSAMIEFLILILGSDQMDEEIISGTLFVSLYSFSGFESSFSRSCAVSVPFLMD